VPLPRGWASVDVRIRGRAFRFVTTYLEAFSPAVRNVQAGQLLAGPAATTLPLVIVGDLNSGPGTDTTAYGILTGAGLSDAAVGAAVTCCHATDLHATSQPLSKRIDVVLTRGGFAPVSTEVVGTDSGDRTASGLWPSDHAGVVAVLRLPPRHGGS